MHQLKRPIFLVIYALILMVIALYNGYPLVESDTGAYIIYGFNFSLPNDRTPFYGVFMRITSFRISLWLPVFAQSLMLAYVLRKYIHFIYPKADLYSELSCIITITAFTCVAWVTAYLMPDVFAAILMLSIILYVYDAAASNTQKLTYLIFIALSILIHNSHFLITGMFATFLLITTVVKKNKALRIKSIVLIAIAASFWAGMSTANYADGHGFTFSKGSHVFMITKFAESGILKSYLDDNCDKKHLKLCDYKDQIPPYSWDFLWNQDGPLYKTGGWDANKEEFNIIIHDVFTTPKYLKMYLEASGIATLRELTQVHAPEQLSTLGSNSQPVKWVREYYSDEVNAYLTSKQNGSFEPLSGVMCNLVYYLFFVLSCLWLLYSKALTDDKSLQVIYSAILIFLVINAFVTATFSTVHYRFQYRVFWVLPATNAILLVRYYYNRRPDASAMEEKLPS